MCCSLKYRGLPSMVILTTAARLLMKEIKLPGIGVKLEAIADPEETHRKQMSGEALLDEEKISERIPAAIVEMKLVRRPGEILWTFTDNAVSDENGSAIEKLSQWSIMAFASNFERK